MMIDGNNMGTITGRLVRDPEVYNNKLVRLGVAVDMSGNDSNNKDNKTGFFTVKKFIDDDPNSKFVMNQISQGNLKKGSAVTVAFRLSHERWVSSEGQKRENVVLMAENITYAPFTGKSADSSSDASTGSNEAESLEVFEKDTTNSEPESSKEEEFDLGSF